MVENQETCGKPSEKEKKIPVFTVLKNGAILKNIFLLDKPPFTASVEESKKIDIEEILVVGRHPDCNIILEHPSISRFHLRIYSNPSSHSLSVLDLSSVHGTWISGKKIEPGVRVELKEGDRMQLGGSSRVYRLHWVPISHAYDLKNSFEPPVSEAETVDETEEKDHQDESDSGSALQNEDNDLVQGLDSSFSNMTLLPYVKTYTPSAPPMPEEGIKSPFPVVDKSPPEKIQEDSEITSSQPDKENSPPQTLLFQSENVDSSTPLRSQQKCLSIWSRRGKHSSVQIQTGRARAVTEKADIDTEVNDLFASGIKDEDVFTPDKENYAPPRTLFLGSEMKSHVADGQATEPLLSCCMDENGEQDFTLDSVDLTANTHLLRSVKKKHPRPLRSSSIKDLSDPILHQAEDREFYKKDKTGSFTMLSSNTTNSEQIFTPDKENMAPDSCSIRSIKKGKLEEVVKYLQPHEKENLTARILEEQKLASVASRNMARQELTILKPGTDRVPFQPLLTDRVLEEPKSASVASRNMASSEPTILKRGTDRVPFQPLLVNSPCKTNSKSPAHKVKARANPMKCQEIMENNNAREETQSWTMVVDTTSLLNKESRKALQLLQGLKGTCLIIPRIVIRELDCMKRRASFFRRATEVSAALEWIEDCLVISKSWVHVQSCWEETRPMAPTPPATAPPSLFSEENSIFPAGSALSSPRCGLKDIVSPTAEDLILESALLFKRTNRDGQLVLLSNDTTMKIEAMAEGLNCETAEDFRESLVNPFSERFLWKDGSPRGSTWSCLDDFVLREPYYPGPLKKPSKSGQTAKGLKLILLHNSHYRQICSGSGSWLNPITKNMEADTAA